MRIVLGSHFFIISWQISLVVHLQSPHSATANTLLPCAVALSKNPQSSSALSNQSCCRSNCSPATQLNTIQEFEAPENYLGLQCNESLLLSLERWNNANVCLVVHLSVSFSFVSVCACKYANFHKSGSADGYLIEVFVCVYEHNHMLSLVNEESSEKVMTQLLPFLMFFRFNCSLSLSTTL